MMMSAPPVAPDARRRGHKWPCENHRNLGSEILDDPVHILGMT